MAVLPLPETIEPVTPACLPVATTSAVVSIDRRKPTPTKRKNISIARPDQCMRPAAIRKTARARASIVTSSQSGNNDIRSI